MKYGRFDEYDDETSDEQWQKIAKLAKKRGSLFDYLYEIGTIDPRSAPLLELAIAEHQQCVETYEAGKDCSEQAGQLQRELEFILRSTQAVDPTTAYKRSAEIETEIATLRNKAEASRIAAIHARGIETRFPRLFSLSPVGEGGNAHWPPVVNAPSPAIHDELNRLGLPSSAIDPWRFFPHIELPIKPRKRLAPLTLSQE